MYVFPSLGFLFCFVFLLKLISWAAALDRDASHNYGNYGTQKELVVWDMCPL